MYVIVCTADCTSPQELYSLETRWDATRPRMRDLSDMVLSADGRTLYLLSQVGDWVCDTAWACGV